MLCLIPYAVSFNVKIEDSFNLPDNNMAIMPSSAINVINTIKILRFFIPIIILMLLHPRVSMSAFMAVSPVVYEPLLQLLPPPLPALTS